jgi:hypothetical protein
MRHILGFGGVALVSLLLYGCDSQEEQNRFEDDAARPPSGIVRTTADGRIAVDGDGVEIENDLDDWRTAPYFAGIVRFDPAYPNPSTGDLITLPVLVQQFNSLTGGLVLRGYDNLGRLVRLDDLPQATQPGSYTFVFSPAQFAVGGDLGAARGLHRVFVFDVTGEITSYGDVLVD